MSRTLPKIIAVVGPTASGKTSLAVRLAKRFGGELVSIDSRQIYRGMDIGTAKDKSCPQHLLDIASPTTAFNVQKCKTLASKSIRNILRRKKLPILVGGTGLYLNAILHNLRIPKVKPDKKLREELEGLSVEALGEKLRLLDPEAASIATHNKRRIIRALEVIAKTGLPFSTQRQKGNPLFDALVLGIRTPREQLFKRIDKRVDTQFKGGLVNEVRRLVKRYGEDAYALQNTIGYKELLPYLRGEINLEKALEEMKKNSRRYAKRQLTWFKAQPNVRWVASVAETEALLRKFLGK